MSKEELMLLHLSWMDIQRLAEKVAEKIRVAGFVPDLIIAISRGGFIPARILCDQLSVRKLASLQIEYYTSVNQKEGEPKVVFPLNADVSELTALLVDDVSDSGNSLRAARDHVLERGASEVKVATFHIKPFSSFKPDFFGEEVEIWIVYPWEPIETLNYIAERLRDKGLSAEEMKKKLIDNGFLPELVYKLV